MNFLKNGVNFRKSGCVGLTEGGVERREFRWCGVYGRWHGVGLTGGVVGFVLVGVGVRARCGMA